MIRYFLLIMICSLCLTAQAQCLSGNCVNGTGKYDFGWCVYEGPFKDSKAEGNGTMAYDDYTYTGTFHNGVENGNGTITYKDGRKEDVTYHNGRKAEKLQVVSAAQYKPLAPKDPNCTSGDCVNGFGTYQYKSGVYTGDFKDRKREGEGRVVFTNGESFVGTWHNNEKVKGTYSFLNGARYTGTYDAEGKELDGTAVKDDIEIPYIKGIAIIPPAKPRVVYTKSSKPSGPQDDYKYRPLCPECKGLGEKHQTIPGGGTATDKYGNRSTVFGRYDKCSRCNGTGHIEFVKK